tara:strand:+ start:676 stop:1287 length:612 start_codon:yes stop_codon:yes gene_type:complete
MLYLDLDGVLANFREGVSEEIWKYATGRKEIIGSKSAPRKIRRYLKEHGRSYKLHTEESLRQKEVKSMLYLVCSQKDFFLNLPVLETRLLEEVGMLLVDYQFLTAGIGEYSVQDKQQWCLTVLRSDKPCNVVVSDGTKSTAELKAEFCKSPTDILVDDTEENIDAWRQAGGIAVHWTGPECLEQLIDILRQQALDQASPENPF